MSAKSTAANRNQALLRAAFRWGIGQELVDATPFTRAGVNVVKLTTEAKRSRRLEPGEDRRLLAACNKTLRPIAEAALETACRSGELLSLQFKQVRLDARQELVLPAGIRTGLLTRECRAELQRINLHFHDLRREAASRWLDSGVVPLSTIQTWLGHANISQTSTYLQSQLVGQNDVMRQFEATGWTPRGVRGRGKKAS